MCRKASAQSELLKASAESHIMIPLNLHCIPKIVEA